MRDLSANPTELVYGPKVRDGRCPICTENCVVASTTGDAQRVLCPRCGEYQISGSAAVTLSGNRDLMTPFNVSLISETAHFCHRNAKIMTTYDFPDEVSGFIEPEWQVGLHEYDSRKPIGDDQPVRDVIGNWKTTSCPICHKEARISDTKHPGGDVEDSLQFECDGCVDVQISGTALSILRANPESAAKAILALRHDAGAYSALPPYVIMSVSSVRACLRIGIAG